MSKDINTEVRQTPEEMVNSFEPINTPPGTPPATPPQEPPVVPPANPPANPPATPPNNPPQEPPVTPESLSKEELEAIGKIGKGEDPSVPPATPPGTPPANPPANPPATPAAHAVADERIAKYDKIAKNEVLNTLVDYVEKGGDLKELFIVGSKPDYDKMTDDDLYKAGLEFYKVPAADFQKEIDSFNGKTAIEKKQFLSQLKDTLTKSLPDTATKFNEVLGNAVKKVQEREGSEAQEVIAARQTAITNLNEKITSVKDFNGVPIPEEDKKDLGYLAGTLTPRSVSPEGKIVFDVNKGFELASKIKYFDKLIENARIEGATRFAKLRLRPNGPGTGNGVGGGGQGGEKEDFSAIGNRHGLHDIDTPLVVIDPFKK
jgi:hypothetical protein